MMKTITLAIVLLLSASCGDDFGSCPDDVETLKSETYAIGPDNTESIFEDGESNQELELDVENKIATLSYVRADGAKVVIKYDLDDPVVTEE